MNRRSLAAALCALIALLTACEPITGSGDSRSAAEKPDEAMVSVMIDSVNYRADRGIEYTLYDLSNGRRTAVGGAIVDPLAGGGAKGCCLALPKQWRPGLKLLLEWGEADFKQIFPEKYARELEIPRYEKPSDLYVVFYPEHEVEVVVSFGEPGHPEWAGRIKQTPWDACVAEQGRKVCKRALPKLFDSESAQGYCVFLKEERKPEDQHRCQQALDECMRDFEDEDFCKKILWGPRRK